MNEALSQLEWTERLQTCESMRPLCGRTVDSIKECHFIICLADGSTFEQSMSCCSMCKYNKLYPDFLINKLDNIRNKIINNEIK